MQDPITEQNLRAGALQMLREHGSLRYILLDGREVIRGLYFALRDENWGTVPFRIEDEEAFIEPDQFRLRFRAVHTLGDTPVFRWDVEIEGTANSTMTFSLRGIALRPFRRNRAGFCVLHPLDECVGKPLWITEPDGTISQQTFPRRIAPNRPFPYLRGMRWFVAEGVEAQLDFEGDDFETEDQRNWGDGSYKTFCTPLALPFPVELQPGDTVEQRIQLRLHFASSGQVARSLLQPEDTVELSLTDDWVPLPGIGTLLPGDGEPVSPEAIEALRALQLDHLRAELRLDLPDWQHHLQFAAEQARAVQTPLLLVLSFGETVEEQTEAFLTEAATLDGLVQDVLLVKNQTYASPTELLQIVVPVLRARWPQVRIGAGTQTNFTELGRYPFDAEALDTITYAYQPQEHAFDDRSLVENIESLTHSLYSARALYPGKAVYVSPVTFRKRFNPYALAFSDRFAEQPVHLQNDSRLRTPFGAGWTLGVLKTIAGAGAEKLTLFRTTGPLGLVQEPRLPVYHLLQTIQGFRGGRVRPVRSSDKLRCSALRLEKADQSVWLIANHTGQACRVQTPDGSYALEPFELKIV